MSDASDKLIQRAADAQRERRLADARQEWIAAIDLLRAEGATVQLAQALRSLGEVERKLHDRDAARAHYEEAVVLYRHTDDPLALAHTIRHLGDVHHDSGRATLAEPCYREALDLYRRHPQASPLDLANAICSMAVLKGETGQAGALWQEARDLYRQVGVTEGVAECSSRLARLAS